MNDDTDILNDVVALPSRERAAALAHWIYVKCSRQNRQWPLRVSESWEQLDPEARNFNLAAIDTWTHSPQVLDAWIAALAECRAADSTG